MKRGFRYWAALCVLLLATGAGAQEVGIETVPVADGIYMLQGQGGNIGVFVGDDGTFLIDDQFAPVTDDILAAVQALDGTAPRFVVNTHYHSDHTGGNENLGRAGAVIVAHANVRARLKSEQAIQFLDSVTPAAPRQALPVITFENGVRFHWNDDTLAVRHVPRGHTDGDSFVHFIEANVIHGGDLLFENGFPFIDYEAGGSIDGLIAGVETMLALTDDKTVLIPGHGDLTDRRWLADYLAMLKDSRQRVANLKDRGLTLDQVIAADPLAHHSDRGGGFMTMRRWLTVVYRSL